MSVHLSKQQLDQLAEGTSEAVEVRDSATKRKYVVLNEAAFRRTRPLFELVTGQFDVSGSGQPAEECEAWTEADNARRIALINKKHDQKLSRREQEELRQLQDRAYQHRDRVAPLRNEVLRLLAEALEKRSKLAK